MTRSSPCKQPPARIDPCHQMQASHFSTQWKLNVQLTGAKRAFQVALNHREGFAISDGSFKDEKGTAAWIIEGSNADIRLVSHWHTPGQPEDHSSFRSELAGIVGVLYTLTFWPPAMEQPSF